MQLKYLKTIIEAQDHEHKVAALCWAPNNLKLAVATADRQVILFDENGEKRDRFSTKPSDPEAGKRSYVIRDMAFSPDSTKLAVAQSDCIVFVYKLGEKWGDKKAICNKFPQPAAVTCLVWLSTGPIICGLTDGKVRALQTKSNKSQSLFASDSLAISLVTNSRGTGFLSGHMDGNIIRFFVTGNENEPQGRVIVHPVPPTALAWAHGHIFVGGCDKRLCVHNSQGKLVKQFDYAKDVNEFDLAVAVSSPSGQAVVVGSFNRLRMYIWSVRKTIWEEIPMKEIKNFYTVSALSWTRDGSKLACGGLCGAVFLFESVLKRTMWKDKFELTYVGPSQVLIKHLEGGLEPIILRSSSGGEIGDIKILGQDSYLVARTETTLIVCDLYRNRSSELTWNHSHEGQEKFYFYTPTVCLVFNAGELTLIEYGTNEALCSVRTEFANPHLISVRLNERSVEGQQVDNKKLAYLLDLKTISIIDVSTNSAGNRVCQINHDSKIDWLELNETSHKLLFRDKKQRLLLYDVHTQNKQTIFSNVSFAQWVENSDVAVAQSGTTLAVWYNIDLPDNPTLLTVKGDVTDVVRSNGKTQAVCLDAGNVTNVELDEGLVEFGTAINDSDYNRAILFLESMGDSSEAQVMWRNLNTLALQQQNLFLAERCFAALKNIAAAQYLAETRQIAFDQKAASNDDTEVTEPMDQWINSPVVWARLAILNGDLNMAENIYLEQGKLESALEMYKTLHKWEDAVRLAEQHGFTGTDKLKKQHMEMLLATGQLEKVGAIMEREGKLEQALQMFLKSGKMHRIPALITQNRSLLSDQTLVATSLKQLLQLDMYEAAASIYEKLKDPKSDQLALECYRKGGIWSKAVELARRVNPSEVVHLEELWGDSLVDEKQSDAAISHYIEAGCTLKALEAAVTASQWKKAVHIIKVVDKDRYEDDIKKYYSQLAQHFSKNNEFDVAEEMWLSCGMYKDAVEMYNTAGQWEKAHSLAVQHLNRDEVAGMYIKQAEQLEQNRKYREAEKLYVSVNAPDLAIAMYKKAEQYDHMIRLVEKYHPDLLQSTHMHLGQQLEAQGKYRSAEIHYLAINEWKTAMNMYRLLGMWEEAYRVAKQNGGIAAANQVAYLWARTLPIDSAIRLLNKYGILDSCVNYACDTYQFDFAFQLCKSLPTKVNEVHYKYAMALEDDGKFSEAESEFISAGKPKEAILMYVHCKNWIQALRIAETHEPSSVPEVLQSQAMQCFADKQFGDFESLLLRAQMPEAIIDKYKSSEMWVDALRVCKDYLPHLYHALQAEYSGSTHYKQSTDVDVETLLSRANEWALAGQHKQAVECLLQIQASNSDRNTERKALLRAADMVNKFLFGQEAYDQVKILAPRLRNCQEYGAAAQLYVSVDAVKEAIDTLMAAEEWEKARKLAQELEPELETYVETEYKDRLTRKGDVEQLADVDFIGALDLLASQGQWVRCIEKAKSHSNSTILHKYVALYAAKLLNDGFAKEALSLYAAHGAPVLTQNFNIYNLIASEIFALPQLNNDPTNYTVWSQLRQMLYEIDEGVHILQSVSAETKQQFNTLLLISHFYALRAACQQVPSLKSISVKISTALLRYSHIIPVDKAFYEAGVDLRSEGKMSQAFVFLNHYLDVCEAIEDADTQLVDHSDLIQTDFPSNVPLPDRLYLIDEPEEHDNIKEWVLTVSMDQKVDQALPLDDRQLFESTLVDGETPCIVSGYPIRRQSVIFSNGRKANKDLWTKLTMGAKLAPSTDVPNALAFIYKWCGNPSST